MNIDFHAHILTRETMRLMQGVSYEHAPRLEGSGAETRLIVGQARAGHTPSGTWDVDERLAEMDRGGVDAQAVTVTPFTFGYQLEPRLAAELCQVQNEQLAALHRQHPTRFFPLGAVPLQDPALAVEVAEQAIGRLGLFGLGLGTRLPDRNLDWPELEPFWAAVERLDVPIMFHPEPRLALPDFQDYYLRNFIGNPLDSTIMIGALAFGGVLQRHPGLKLVIVHAGGFIPYQFGRFDHGWRVRPEAKVRLDQPPSTFIRRLYFDTIAHSTAALEYLVGEFGADHVVLGTDYPYDMGLTDPVGLVESLRTPDAAGKALIKGGTAARLLKLDQRHGS